VNPKPQSFDGGPSGQSSIPPLVYRPVRPKLPALQPTDENVFRRRVLNRTVPAIVHLEQSIPNGLVGTHGQLSAMHRRRQRSDRTRLRVVNAPVVIEQSQQTIQRDLGYGFAQDRLCRKGPREEPVPLTANMSTACVRHNTLLGLNCPDGAAVSPIRTTAGGAGLSSASQQFSQ